MVAFEEELVEYAIDAMNDVFNAGFNKDNLVACFYDADNAVRDEFMQRFGFSIEGTAQDGDGEAFCYGKDGVNGILIRRIEDEGRMLHTILHELCHIFCTLNEIDGGHFFDKYCMGERSEEDGIINAGYAIWREAIAEVMAKEISPDMTPRHLNKSMQQEIDHYRNVTSPRNPMDKYALSNMIDTIMSIEEVRAGMDWAELEPKLKELETPYMEVVELAYIQIGKDKPYAISKDFIVALGNAFIAEKSVRAIRELF